MIVQHPLFCGNNREPIATTRREDCGPQSGIVIDRPQHSESRGGTGERGGSLPIPRPLPEIEAVGSRGGLHPRDGLLPRISRDHLAIVSDPLFGGDILNAVTTTRCDDFLK